MRPKRSVNKIALNQLAVQGGETENARECHNIKEDKLGRSLHKLDGYALSENAENLDLFISIYRDYDQPERLSRDEIQTAFNQIERFFTNAVKGYWEDLDESDQAFDFARELYKNGKDIVRARLFLLTNQRYGGEAPPSKSLKTNSLEVLVKYPGLKARTVRRCGLVPETEVPRP